MYIDHVYFLTICRAMRDEIFLILVHGSFMEHVGILLNENRIN